MRRRLTVDAPIGASTPGVNLDGRPTDRVRWVEGLGMPFVGIYFDGERQFDVELWVNGTLRSVVPTRRPEVEVVYDHIEGIATDDPLPALPPSSSSMALRKAVLAEMAAHPGSQAQGSWESLHRMYLVHARNGAELIAILQAPGSDFMLATEMVQNTGPANVRDAVNAEIDQRLHNYVASTASLIDQTRRITERYEGTHFHDEYAARRDAITSSPVVGFVRDLRNFALHHSLPFVGHSVSFQMASDPKTPGMVESFEATIGLSTEALIRWDGWKAAAKEYLRAAGDTVDLLQAVTTHLEAFDEVWVWLFGQRQGLHQIDLIGWGELAQEHDWLLSGGREGRPRRAWAMLST